MLRIVSEWTGFTGGPGYTNLYFDGLLEGGTQPQQCAQKVKDFWVAIASRIPATVVITTRSVVEQVDPVTGLLIGETVLATPLAGTAGTGAGNYAAVAGACVSWGTAGVVAGKRVRGKTFLVPLAAASYDVDGTLSSATLNQLRPAAAALVAPPISAGADLGVWHRPTGGAGGSWHKTTSSKVNDKTAFLKSRRD